MRSPPTTRPSPVTPRRRTPRRARLPPPVTRSRPTTTPPRQATMTVRSPRPRPRPRPRPPPRLRRPRPRQRVAHRARLSPCRARAWARRPRQEARWPRSRWLSSAPAWRWSPGGGSSAAKQPRGNGTFGTRRRGWSPDQPRRFVRLTRNPSERRFGPPGPPILGGVRRWEGVYMAGGVSGRTGSPRDGWPRGEPRTTAATGRPLP